MRKTPFLLLLLTACPHQVPLPKGPSQPVSYRLLAEAPELETSARTEQRPDVFVRTDQFDHTPVVVAKGEAGPLSLQGGRAQLCADEACTQGISVDNFILFEVVEPSGTIKHRFAVGYHSGLTVENQEPDNVGANSFNFDPGLDVTAQLPAESEFSLRATALDYGGVGRVSNVFLRVSPVSERTPSDDELKSR
ncbi:MAG: hypothetical protein JST54_05150 [Deltaproteobacteria bacterium]|nr:hypothetical protein [Deltaproteobacteria bacterium]